MDSSLPTVYRAWSAVMQSVRAIEKNDRNSQGPGFMFRGIDATMQAVGPALREHGVIVVPTGQDIRTESYATSKGTQMKNVTVTVEYTVYGPGGDSFTGISYGEAADAGDKAVTKAQSVALRTFLLQSLMVPTGDPDPDASTHERGTDNSGGLQALGNLCAEKGWTSKEQKVSVANAFSTKYHTPVDRASNDDLLAFVALVSTGALVFGFDDEPNGG
jgi:ERF superfamily protein